MGIRKYTKEDLRAFQARKKQKVMRFVCEAINKAGGYAKHITLTFRDMCSFNEFYHTKRGIGEYLRYLRSLYYKRTGRLDIEFVWSVELQERGVPHYHIIVVSGVYFEVPFPDQTKHWPWGMSQVKNLRYISRNYLAKYMSKASQLLVSAKEILGVKLRTYGFPNKLRKLRLFRFFCRFRQVFQEFVGKRVRAVTEFYQGCLCLLGYRVQGIDEWVDVETFWWWEDQVRKWIWAEMEANGESELRREVVREVLGWSQ